MTTNERFSYERKIIASILQSENNFTDVIAFGLTDDIFLTQICKDAYNAGMQYIFEHNQIPNHIDLYRFLIPSKNLELKKFIIEIGKIPPDFNILIYVKHLLEQNISNELIEIAKTIQSSKDFGIDLAHDVNNRITNVIYKYFQKYTSDKPVGESLDELIANINTARSGNTNRYIKTGIKNLDNYFIGFHKQSVCVIGSRPGIGKTAFMQQCNRNILAQGYKTGIISIEMDSESLLIRDLSSKCKINSVSIENGSLTNDEMNSIAKATEELRIENFQIDDDSNQTPKKIMATINKWKIQHKTDIIFIDYFQLIKPDETKEKTQIRYDLVMGNIMGEFRRFCKSTGTPIVLLSQLNRKNEDRQDKRPQLSDLRESGAIEQDARQVLLLHCPDYYGVNPFEGKNAIDELYTENNELLDRAEYFEVLIAKNRGGKTGLTKLCYLKPINTFENCHKKNQDWQQIPAKPNNEPYEKENSEPAVDEELPF